MANRISSPAQSVDGRRAARRGHNDNAGHGVEMVHKLLAAAALAAAGLAAAPVVAQDADLAAKGEKVFKRCAACHQIGPEAKSRVGPSLEGVVGRTAGTLEGFSYSDAMTEAGANGLVWNSETLHEYLADPKAMVKGTKMAFAGLKKEEDRDAVIAYIEFRRRGHVTAARRWARE